MSCLKDELWLFAKLIPLFAAMAVAIALVATTLVGMASAAYAGNWSSGPAIQSLSARVAALEAQVAELRQNEGGR